jgi:glutamyl-tRNA synthetase
MRTALFNWLLARREGGVFIVRMEDTDRARSTPESARAILDGLRWLGLDWDEGPEVGGPDEPYYQSQRLDLYAAEAARLEASGAGYRCYCTPEELAERRKALSARNQAPRYDRKCRHLTEAERRKLEGEGRASVLRFAIPQDGETLFEDLIRGGVSFRNAEVDDWVVIKADGYPTYNFAVAVDDHAMGITHVIRGEDHISNTPKQILAYEALGYPLPLFAHLPMILGKDRTKLAKRHGATSIIEYREMGYLPEAMFNYLALLGWSPGDGREVMTREEIVEAFSLEGVTTHAAVFDSEKLAWLNGQHMRAMSVEDFVTTTTTALQGARVVAAPPSPEEERTIRWIAPDIQPRVNLISQIPGMAKHYFAELPDYDPAAVEKRLRQEGAAEVLQRAAEAYEGVVEWSADELERVTRALAESMGLATSKVFHPIRVAVTGTTVGPGLFDTLYHVGRERVVKRLRHAVSLGGVALEKLSNAGGR